VTPTNRPPVYAEVSGRALWTALGFANERAFQRARQANAIALPLYPIGGQARGVYARSDELAVYLANADAPQLKGSRLMKP
jgi:hypothetical protein